MEPRTSVQRTKEQGRTGLCHRKQAAQLADTTGVGLTQGGRVPLKITTPENAWGDA